MSIGIDEYQDRIIVFIDILGFREHINLTENDPVHFNKMKKVFYYMSRLEKNNTEGFLAQKEEGKEVTVFSDSAVISYPADYPGAVFYLLMDIVHLQLDMLANGIILRGGFTVGKLCHQDNIVFGPAMVEAFELESKTAVYPRVIVSDKIFEVAAQYRLNPLKVEFEYIKSLLKKDIDGHYYIDFMRQWQEADEYSDYFDALAEVKIIIEKAFIDYSCDSHVLEKYQWLKRYYNSTLDGIQQEYTKGLYIR